MIATLVAQILFSITVDSASLSLFVQLASVLFVWRVARCLAHAFNVKVDEGSRQQSGLIEAAIYDWRSKMHLEKVSGCKKKKLIASILSNKFQTLPFPFSLYKYI